MFTRIITSLVGLVVFFGVVVAPQYVLFAVLTVLVIATLYEMYSAMHVGRLLKIMGYVSAAFICAGFATNKIVIAIYASCMLFMLAMIMLHGKVTCKKVMAVAFVTIFISMFLMVLTLLRKNCGKYIFILPFVCAWLTDTGAYFVGSCCGKHKLVPHISPKKTVEGAVGGIICAVVGSFAFYYVLHYTHAAYPVQDIVMALKFALVGMLGSITAQIGDLIASCIKRDYNKKDYGNILPGHGGILDRFDSVIFVSPFVYYAVMYMLR